MNEPVEEWLTSAPTGRLRAFVERYVGYRLTGFAPGIHRGLPSRHMTFIASIGPTIDVVAQTNPAQGPRSYRCVIGGLQASAALIAHNGNQAGVAIELTPLGSRTLLGMPARELWDQALEFSELAGAGGADLWDRLQEPSDWQTRFGVCDEFLSRLVREDAVDPELQHSWQALVDSGGRISVSELAGDTGYSRQHLSRRFRDEFGLSPKLAARVLRFDRAGAMLQRVPSFVSVAQVATTCGYYDQAHLYRDFADLAGCTPRELVGDEDLPFFQDESVDDAS